MIPLFSLSLLFSLALCVHVVRTGREMFWLFIILLFQPLGGLVYAVAIVLPELSGGRAARNLGAAARTTFSGGREHRNAKAAHDESPTVANAMRLARAATALGRHDEAEQLYLEASQGIHADDPTLLLGRASALIELGRNDEALAVLDQLGNDADRSRTPQAALARGRALEALGRNDEAETAYDWAAGRLPGLEGLARQAAFMARTGRKSEAQSTLKEIDRRLAHTDTAFRREARAWRDLAAKAVAES